MYFVPANELSRRLLATCVLFAFLLTGYGAEVTNTLQLKLQAVPACSNLIADAILNHVPMDGIGPVSGSTNILAGDSITVLITLFQKEKQTQWLLYLEALPTDPAKSREGTNKFTVTSSFGPPELFYSRPVDVKLRLLGPYGVQGHLFKVWKDEKNAQFSLNEDFLALGFDHAAALLYRWGQTTNFTGPISSKVLVAMKPTPEEQRAICGIFPALLSYIGIVQNTRGLEELMYKVVTLPSLKSMIVHRGIDADVTYGNGKVPAPVKAEDWGLPSSAPAYTFPWLVKLDGEDAMTITLVVTQPKLPLMMCGGVVGLLAEKAGDDETYMLMRLVSAKTINQ
ncbi:MAG TPA: hypothetical protein VH255_06420 [Verrucomicrobiae bacterium]|nr:hypothetical protein [Verrucomicrobiae bacterium]